MDVMMKMTTEDVRRLRAQFSAPLTLEQFVPLMKMNLRDRITNELDFIVGAVDLFHTIDVNGDRALEWDEFAGYMLDAGQAKADFGLDRSDRDGKLYQPWELAFRDAKTPMNCIKSHVQQLIYLPDMAAVAYFERGGDVVSIYALHFDQNEAPRHFATIRLHTAFQEHVVLDMCYVPVKKWLAISSMRGALAYLSVWQMPEPTSHSRSPMMLRRIELVSPQEQLTWLPSLQLLATASAVFPSMASHQKTTKIHQLLLWDLATLTTHSDFDHRDRIKGVTSMVGYATPSNRVFLVVGREDGQITVIETETGQDVQTLDAHGHGVRVLTYSSECEVLASAGAHAYASDESSLHILIWRIHSSGRLRIEATLRDHDAPLVLLQFVDSKRQLLSADCHGVYHVYSSAGRSPSLEQWQSLQVFEASYRINECALIPESAHSDAVLITAGDHIAFFDLCVSREREEVFFAYYCRELNLVVAVTSTTVLLWSADTGRLWKSFTYPSILRSTPPSGHNDAASDDSYLCRAITSVCVDDRERKLLLGDDRGSVRVVNIVNGNVMKALDPHESAVLWLSYVLRSKRVISISLDGVLHVSDENNPIGYYVPFGSTKPQSVVLRALRFLPDSSSPSTTTETLEDYGDASDTPPTPPAKFEISRAVGNQALDLLAVLVSGTQHGESFVQLWNFDMSHAQGTCVAPTAEEITCLSFLGSTADVVGGTSSGVVLVWATTAADGITYRCAFELIAELEEKEQEPSDEDPEQTEPSELPTTLPPSNGPILHVLTITAETATTTEETTPETSTFLTADGAPAGTESPMSNADSATNAFSSLNKNRRIEDQGRGESLGGVYVVAGDETGVITTWLVTTSVPTNPKPNVVATRAQEGKPSTKGQNNTAPSQHEETAMGYEAIAALHAKALARTNRQPREICRSRARWQAHRSAVSSLRQSSGDPLILLSSSAAGKVKVWNLQGDLVGVLDYFATRRVPERRPWRFPGDMELRLRQKELFAAQFLDRNSTGDASKRGTARMTVLQERLSMTPQEMANTPKSAMRRRITKVVQLGDVERAIRNLALSQVSSSLSKRNSSSRARSRSIPATPIEPSLHVLLTEVSEMQPPKTAPTGDTGSVLAAEGELIGGGRRRYSMVTIDDLKHALRPRSRMSKLPSSKARSSSTVHCDLTPSPPPASSYSTREVIVTASPATDGRIELTDLRSGALDRDASNQDGDAKPLKKKADGVLNYHVKLAHSWNKYAS